MRILFSIALHLRIWISTKNNEIENRHSLALYTKTIPGPQTQPSHRGTYLVEFRASS